MRWLGLITLLFTGVAAFWAADVKPADDTKGFLVHEWGVWRVHDDLEFANADMRAEWDDLPAFVYGQTTTRDFPRHEDRGLMIVTKPVIFFHSLQPLEVEVRVAFTTGVPAVWWPATRYPAHITDARFGEFTKVQRPVKNLDWKLYVKNRPGGQPLAIPLKPLRNAHWMKTLRDVKCEDVYAPLSEHGGALERERFVYYDGLLQPVKAVAMKLDRERASLKNMEKFTIHDVWVVDNRDRNKRRVGQLPRLDADATKDLDLVAVKDARWYAEADKTLTAQLKAAGLHEDEAASLTTIWTDAFFRSEGVTVFYRLPPEEYDRLLPLQVTPRPEKIVRVGLIQQVPYDPEFAKRIARLVKQLDDDDFDKREKAQAELAKLGPVALGYLRKLAPTIAAPEPKRRVEDLLEKLESQRILLK